MSWPQNVPKRVQGEVFTCLSDLARHLDAGGWVFYRHKAYHPLVISNWSLSQLTHFCRYGKFCRAELNPKRTWDRTAADEATEKRVANARQKAARARFLLANGERTGP